jgi:hypothetical protein
VQQTVPRVIKLKFFRFCGVMRLISISSLVFLALIASVYAGKNKKKQAPKEDEDFDAVLAKYGQQRL